MSEDRQQLARELGALHMARALERIERAQNLLNEASADLSAVWGAMKVWRSVGRLADRARKEWGDVSQLRDRLISGGGPRVDDLHIDAELRRRRTPAHGLEQQPQQPPCPGCGAIDHHTDDCPSVTGRPMDRSAQIEQARRALRDPAPLAPPVMLRASAIEVPRAVAEALYGIGEDLGAAEVHYQIREALGRVRR